MFRILESEDFIDERNQILTNIYKKTYSQEITLNLFNEIEKNLLLIKENPKIFRKRESNFRIIPMNSYSILYKVFEKEKLIKVYSIVYSASDYKEYQ